MNKIISFSFLIYPFLSYIIMSYFDIDFFWHYSENYIVISTIYSIICFALFTVGLFTLLDKSKYYVTIFISFIFLCYHLFTWSFKSVNFTDKIEVGENTYIVLSHQGFGAVGEDFLNIVLVTKLNYFFIRKSIVRAVEGTSEAKTLEIDKEKRIVSISYESHNFDRIVKTINIEY
ncbi:hypothetical protein VT06_16600 [Arsukibacterium sp. MJ3]|uniref:hypothetical protein n=1 Tax=Arsukibacterium sp. MJ3 TaxID=1632859 RepID=UPI0006272E83|nr:hypothetical protein [Arsukibacterium sp. MJ3]KKO47528.1 hypothetical protein VT06_16600 [Arsukibacterium sp. MJ3]